MRSGQIYVERREYRVMRMKLMVLGVKEIFSGLRDLVKLLFLPHYFRAEIEFMFYSKEFLSVDAFIDSQLT